MKYTSIIEKIVWLVNLMMNSWVYLLFLGVLFLLVIMLIGKKLSKKVSIFLIFLSYLLLFGYTVYQNYDNLGVVVDSIMNNMFTSIYFPSVYVYLFTLIVMDGATIVSLLNIKGEKIYKVVNGIGFFIINFLFVLVMEIVSHNKIDVFSKVSLFGNKDLIVLLEFSINIFILWLVSLITVYFINMITSRVVVMRANKELKGEVSTTDGILAVEEVKVEEEVKDIPVSDEVESTCTFIPKELFVSGVNNQSNNYQFIPNTSMDTNTMSNTFDLSELVAPRTNMGNNGNNNILEQILNNQLPVMENNYQVNYSEENKEKDSYTLNDYRIFNKMLKDIKEYNQSNTISIDKNMEYRLITKYSSETYDMFKRMLKNYSN